MTDSGSHEMGWHPDPYGRHQYRFWDGMRWTERVADGGDETSDPPVPSGPPATAHSAAAAGDRAGGDAEAAPPERAGTKRWAVVGAAGAVTAVIVLVLVFVVFDKGGSGSSLGTGTGTFTARVDKGQAKVRTFDVRPGDFVSIKWRTPEGDAKVAWAVDRSAAEKLKGRTGLLEDSDLSDAYDSAQTLLSDASDSDGAFKDATRKHPYVKVDGFEGLVSDASSFLSPVGGKFAVIVVGKTKATVKAQVLVKHLGGKNVSDFSDSGAYDSFYSGLDSGFYDSELTDECADQNQYTDGFCREYDTGSSSDSFS